MARREARRHRRAIRSQARTASAASAWSRSGNASLSPSRCPVPVKIRRYARREGPPRRFPSRTAHSAPAEATAGLISRRLDQAGERQPGLAPASQPRSRGPSPKGPKPRLRAACGQRRSHHRRRGVTRIAGATSSAARHEARNDNGPGRFDLALPGPFVSEGLASRDAEGASSPPCEAADPHFLTAFPPHHSQRPRQRRPPIPPARLSPR